MQYREKMPSRLRLRVGILALAMLAAVARGSTTISSFPLNPTGAIATSVDVGQSFIAPAGTDNYLSSFTGYYFGSGGPTLYTLSVYPFDSTASQVTGPALYTSPTMTSNPSSFPPFPVTTITPSTPILLTPGGGYIFVFTQNGFGNVNRNLQWNTNDNYPDGRFYLVEGSPPYNGDNWTPYQLDNHLDIGFSATFVPEPAAALSIALFASGTLLRRRAIGRCARA